jgi:tRNA threonylcarbamoyladenosine biosynthesis protein TsaE
MSQVAMHRLTLESSDPQATAALGRLLGTLLEAGTVIALVGPMGAGKTFLVRAIAEGLGLTNPRAVTSPTFVLIQEYSARLPIYHFDAYRLHSEAEFAELGAHEYFADGICLIEWADRVAGSLPAERLTITLYVTGKTSRRIEVEARGASIAALMHQLHQSHPDSKWVPS